MFYCSATKPNQNQRHVGYVYILLRKSKNICAKGYPFETRLRFRVKRKAPQTRGFFMVRMLAVASRPALVLCALVLCALA